MRRGGTSCVTTFSRRGILGTGKRFALGLGTEMYAGDLRAGSTGGSVYPPLVARGKVASTMRCRKTSLGLVGRLRLN